MGKSKFDPIPGEIVPSWSVDLRRTFKLFLPIFLGSIATTAMGVVDTVMAGMAGTVQLSGVAIGASLYWPCVLFVMGMTLAIQPTVAQLRGAGRTEEIAAKIHLISVITLITSVIVGIIMCFLPLCYKLMDDIDQEMVRVAQLYLYAVAAGMPAIALFNILRGYWEGLGNTVPTSVFGFIALFLNIPLNWIFIFGHFGMPALGGVGCGVATSITMYICAILMLIYVLKSKTYAKYRIYQHWFALHWPEVKQFLQFALPLALSTTIEVTCFSLVAVLLSPFGPVTVAAHSVAMNVSGVIFMIPLAIASAATIRVGEALGAGHWNRAFRSSMGAYGLAFFFYLFSVLTIIFFHQEIIELYSSDPEVIVLASLLLMFCAVYQFPDSMQVVSIGILRGFKDSKTIFAITVVSYWVIGMPIGYTLAYGYLTGEKMAAQGFWIGFICSLSCAFLLYVVRIIYIYRRRKLPKTFHIMHSEGVPL
ncbi:MAG: MATE family efflux transporter [Anaerobiospirillum sp.]|nr:MATE family efflux transporter [Anaerobiospirillum sp.]